MHTKPHGSTDDREIVGAAERLAQSARAVAERRFTEIGAAADANALNPYKPGSAAATWWQRGRDAAAAIINANRSTS